MLADSQQSSTDRILNLKTENAVGATPVKKAKIQDTRYQCVVCQTNKVSLSELHWHQTYQHSTEELSLSVIGWKGLVKIVGPPSMQEKENTQRSIWNSFSKKPSQFYYLSSSILRVKDNPQKGNVEAPIDCSLPPSSLSVVKLEKAEKVEEPNKEDEKVNTVVESTTTEDPSQDPSAFEKWEKELNCIKEISMDDFIKGVDELCSDLEEYKKICAMKKPQKRKHII